MAVDAEDLIIQPFKELVQRGKEAIKSAQDAQDAHHDGISVETTNQMLKSANGVVKEGERALQKLYPLWASQLERYGEAFLEAINNNDAISESRVALDDLLYDFDDFTEVESFDAERYAEVQVAAKSFGRTVIETIKRLRIERSVDIAARSATPTDAHVHHVFPPLPPLPILPSIIQRSTASQPPTSPVTQTTDDMFVPPVRVKQNHLKRGPSSRSEVSAKNIGRRSVISDASSAEIWSARRLNFQQILPSGTASTAHVTRQPLSPDVLGAGLGNAQIMNEDDTSMTREPHSVLPNGSAPRTTAWVQEQASSTQFKSPGDSIPEEMPIPSNFSSRYTVRSSERDSSVFDAATSPTTTRASIFSSANESAYKHVPSLPPLPDTDLRINLYSPTRLETPIEKPQAARTLTLRPFPVMQDVENGLMLADEALGSKAYAGANNTPRSNWHANQPRCEIGPQSSLFTMGGFCKGAHLFANDGMEMGTKSSYEFMSKTYKAQCIDCEYEQDMSRLLADMKKDRKAYHVNKGVRYRLRFLYKSHIFTNTGGIKNYACLFCSHDGYTTREGDATVFGSLNSLFGHLGRHPQPLPAVTGIKILYGEEKSLDTGDLQDYDLYFPKPTDSSSISEDQAAKLARLPVARAIKSHDIREGEVDLVGPDGKKECPLPFFAGGRIIGVEFIEKWEGKYCTGWHDDVRGFFPSKLVELEAPPRGEVRLPGMNGDGITVKARWKWAPKDSMIGWLSFKPGDTISNVSWTFQEQWCWSGMIKNGKVGFFPQSHIKPESVRDMISNDTSTASIKSGNSAKTKKSTRTFGFHMRSSTKNP